MAVTYGFYNALNHDRLYDAIQMSSIFDGIIQDGIFSTIGTSMIVTAPEDGMYVDVGPGRAWFNHTWTLNDTEYPVEAEEAEVVLDRIDAVILEVNAAAEVRANSIKFLKGTPSSEPVKPTLIHNAEVNQYALAYVTIRAGQTTIFQSDIENVVGTDETPFVTGLLQQVSVEQLLLQWNDDFYRYFAAFQAHNNAEFNTWMEAKVADYNQWYAAMEEEGAQDLATFDTWFQHMKDQLDEDAAGHLQAEIDQLAEDCQKGSVFTVTTDETELINRSCVISQGLESVTKQFDANGVASFPSMPYIGAIHVESTDGDNVAQGDMTIPYFGRYSMEIAFWAATFNISTSADGLIGRPITITKGGVVVGTTSFNASGRATYKVHEPGTYIVSSSTAGGDEYATTVVVTEETAYAVNLGIPSGETATPTDDIQTWLKCASIYDKSYTLLADVLDDYYTCERLFSDSNACDYMARSSSWAAIVCTDASVMEQISKYSYCCSKLLGDSTWKTTILNSDYVDCIYDVSVPKMTSNSAPKGTVIFSSKQYNSGYDPWMAFDKNNATYWHAKNTRPHYIGYQFTSPVVITEVSIIDSASWDFKIQAYDGSNWIDLLSDSYTGSTQTYVKEIYSIENNTAYSQYRLYSQNGRPDNYMTVIELQFYGRSESQVQTDLIHSAAYDTIYYYDSNSVERQLCVTDENGIGTVDWSEMEPGIYTFYSSVAKDPDDLESDYSRTVKITKTTTEVYLMPENALYWYGYEDADLDDLNATDGWSFGGSFDAPQHLPNKVYLISTSNSAHSGICKKNKTSGISKINYEGLTARGGSYGELFSMPTKVYDSSTYTRDRAMSAGDVLLELGLDDRYTGVLAYGANTNGRESGYVHSFTILNRSITLYSAAYDTIYYLGENNVHIPIAKTDRLGMASVDLGLLPQGTYTLYSSVAKDPENLSNPYSKTVTIGPDTRRIYLMPEGTVLYWWGYNNPDNPLMVCTSANGWGTGGSGSSLTTDNITFDINQITMIGGNGRKGFGTNKTITINSEIHIVASQNPANSSETVGFSTTKSVYYGSWENQLSLPASTTLDHRALQVSQPLTNRYVVFGTGSSVTEVCAACWYV